MLRRYKRAISGVLYALILLSNITCHTLAISTSATSAILMDADSGRVFYAQNADQKMLIASITKIMTALVAIEKGELSELVTVKRAYTLVEGSSMYLKEGEQLTLETLLYGLLLCSGNDAAVAVADTVGGSVSQFVAMMNEKAKELGMTSSSFANPNGLDDKNHYSTARDMSRLAAAAVQNQTFLRIASTRTVSIGGRRMTNHNKLLSYVDGCIGMKTGYTKAAGRTLVSAASQKGQKLIAVTLRDGNDWADHAALFSYGFATYPAKLLCAQGDTVKHISVESGTSKMAELTAAGSFAYPLAAKETVETKLILPEKLVAPVYAGDRVGKLVFSFDGREVGQVELCVKTDIALKIPEPLHIFHKIKMKIQR